MMLFNTFNFFLSSSLNCLAVYACALAPMLFKLKNVAILCFSFSPIGAAEMHFDLTSYFFFLLLIGISTLVSNFSWAYFNNVPIYFFTVLWSFVFSMGGLIFSGDLMIAVCFWDGLGLTSFLLISFYNNRCSLGGGMFTMLLMRGGDVFLLWAACLSMLVGDSCTSGLMGLGVMMAAFTKSALLPFSPWLPMAMVAPTPVSALVHSSTLVTAGYYVVIRWYFLFSSDVLQMLIIQGMSTFIAASVWALYEFDLKKVVALSTMSQLGLIGVSLGNHLPQLAFVHLSVHALFKSGLFMMTGMVILANGGQQDSRVMTPSSNNFTPVTKFALLNSFSLASVPFSGGFYSKEMLENAIYSSSYMSDMSLVIFFSSVPLTVAYAFRLISFFFTGNPKSPPLTSSKLSLNMSLFFTCSLGSLSTILMTKWLKWSATSIMSETGSEPLLFWTMVFPTPLLIYLVTKLESQNSPSKNSLIYKFSLSNFHSFWATFNALPVRSGINYNIWELSFAKQIQFLFYSPPQEDWLNFNSGEVKTSAKMVGVLIFIVLIMKSSH